VATKSMTWMTWNGQNALLRKNRFTESTRKILMKIDPYCEPQNVGQRF